MSAALRIGLAFVASLALAAPARAASVTFEGVVVAGEGLAIDSMPRLSDAPPAGLGRIRDATVTVEHERLGRRSVRTDDRGRFRLQVPSDWLDAECGFAVASDDHSGMLLPCRDALGADLVRPPRLLITLPAPAPAVVLASAVASAPDLVTEVRTVVAERLASLHAMDDRGMEWTRAAFQGRWTLLDFTSPTCGPCRGERRRLKEGHGELSRAGVAVLHLTLPLDPRAAAAGAKAPPPSPWPSVTITGEDMALWHVTALPTNVLIGPDGGPVAIDIHGDDMVAEILRLANGGKPVRAALSR